MQETSHPTANETPVTTDTAGSTPPEPAPPAARGRRREAKAPTVGELRRERKHLWEAREDAVYHVGGLAVDLRRRGIDEPELINHRADGVLAIDARLNEVDAALAQVDPHRRGAPSAPAAGYCMSCGAPFQFEAAFCFRCGARVLTPDETEEPAAAGDQPTAVLDGGRG